MSGERSIDASADAAPDVSGDGQWLTYAELAQRRGIDRSSAVRLAIRRHWRRQKGNTGREIRVLVPPEWLTPDTSEHTSGHVSADIVSVTRAFEAAIAALRERAEAAEQGRDRAEGTAADLRGRIETLQTALDAARVAHHAAQEAAESLRAADAARRGQGRWTRLRAAWRGQ